jgi:activator of 2-hydroxyglutaryl-CoA dehydratase
MLRVQLESRGASLEVLGVGATGYAKDILKDVLNADVELVETRAHTESALKFYDDPHVIVDVGGQYIKLIVLKDGRVKDFKLNTQCSAGNGYFLQSTAEGFGMKVEEFAGVAFAAKSMPSFGYAAQSSCSPTLLTSNARAGGQKRFSRASQTCSQRTSSST